MPDVLIVGAGLAGLACACELFTSGVSSQILEASDGVGGRARTDVLDGFLLDRGFQVLLTAYPEAQRLLDYGALGLSSFAPGALVRFDDQFHAVDDPWRRPSKALRGLVSPVGSLRDKLKTAQLRRRVTHSSLQGLFNAPETSTLEALREQGFSDNMIERFFRPFFGGIFLERELRTSSRLFEFVFRMFSLGEAALPAAGMGAIAQQLLGRLPEGCVRLQGKVVGVAPRVVRLASGEDISAEIIVVATEQAAAAQLLGATAPTASRGTTCFYFAAEKPPMTEPMLVLSADGQGPVNNFCVPSLVSRGYAPAGAHLVSASVVGEGAKAPNDLFAAVRNHLARWFGNDVYRWRPLRSYWIADALPEQTTVCGVAAPKDDLAAPGVYVCGDHRDTASINGALASGRRTAEVIARSLGRDISAFAS